jgi:glycosyltransferase involved in cell wall biosynthesis
MNILFVVPYVPSLIRARSYNLIRHLSARGHRVTVVTLWANERERADAEALRPSCHAVEALHLPKSRSLVNCIQALPGSEPLQAAYSWSPALVGRVLALQAGADIVHVEHLRGARYALQAASQSARATAPVVWDSVDCISYLFEQAATSRHDRVGRLINRLELARTRRHEGWLLRQFDRVLITSDVDKQAITGLASSFPDANGYEPAVTVVPNGVDTSYFTPTDEPREPQTLIFSGKMSYHANIRSAVHLIAEIMPHVWARMPDVRLSIVGKDPPPSLRALAARHSHLVTVTGTVPDVRPFLRKASAAVIPLVYGAGSQFKVLEAMACATPVVATSRAVSALRTRNGHDVLVADGAEAFAQSILELVESRSRQRDIGRAGRQYVEAHHQWAQIAGDLEAIYHDVRAHRVRAHRATA